MAKKDRRQKSHKVLLIFFYERTSLVDFINGRVFLSVCQSLAALGAPALKYILTGFTGHALHKAVLTAAPTLFRLVSLFRHISYTLPQVKVIRN